MTQQVRVRVRRKWNFPMTVIVELPVSLPVISKIFFQKAEQERQRKADAKRKAEEEAALEAKKAAEEKAAKEAEEAKKPKRKVV